MSFYTSLTGLKGAQTDLATISHNLANVETNGFKRSRTDFIDLVAGSALTDPRKVTGVGSAVQSITQIFTQGTVEQTGAGLDLAITGDGYFAVRSPGGAKDTMFTRNGAFTADAEGFVVDQTANRLQAFAVDAAGNTTGAPGDLKLPAANAAGAPFAGVTINDRGLVEASFADGTTEEVGRVALANFPSPVGLRQIGSTHWKVTGLSGAPTYGEPNQGAYGALLSGAVERSNVDITEELVGLISAQRNFQANAKAIDTAGQLTQSILQIRS